MCCHLVKVFVSCVMCQLYIPICCLQCLDFWEACEDGDVDMVLASLSAGVGVNITTPVSWKMVQLCMNIFRTATPCRLQRAPEARC